MEILLSFSLINHPPPTPLIIPLPPSPRQEDTKASKAKATEAAKKMSDLQKQAKASQREAAKKAAAEKKIEVDAAKLAMNEVNLCDMFDFLFLSCVSCCCFLWWIWIVIALNCRAFFFLIIHSFSRSHRQAKHCPFYKLLYIPFPHLINRPIWRPNWTKQRKTSTIWRL